MREFFLLLVLALPVQAAAPSPEQLSQTVVLYGRQQVGTLQATGFVVDAARGWVVTTWHFWSSVSEPGVLPPGFDKGVLEVAPSPYMNRYFRGEGHAARLIWYEAAADLALVEVTDLPKSVKQVAFSADPTVEGQQVQALGNPFARNAMWELDAGKVTGSRDAIWRYAHGQEIATSVFEFAVEKPLVTGFSGGPVFNEKGQLAGMVIAAATPDGLSVYAVEAAIIERFVARTHAHIALKQQQKGDAAGALTHANLAVGYAPGDAAVHFARARVYLQQVKVAEARSDLAAAAKRFPAMRMMYQMWDAGSAIAKTHGK